MLSQSNDELVCLGISSNMFFILQANRAEIYDSIYVQQIYLFGYLSSLLCFSVLVHAFLVKLAVRTPTSLCIIYQSR